MKKNVITNFSYGCWYPLGQDRLSRSLDTYGECADRLFYKNVYPPNCPTHQQAPYAFKPYCFIEAQRLGYQNVLWVDSAVWAIKDIAPIFESIEKEGWYFQLNTANLGLYCKDAALKTLGITREESFKMWQLLGCIMGLNLHNPKCIEFLSEWKRLADDGITFPGPWNNDNHESSVLDEVLGHRHDQTAASVLANKLGMAFHVVDESGIEENNIFMHYTCWNRPNNNKTLFLSEGM